ncbi:prepilin peptidase [Candidatus Pacearchaeota archaeon]|nr:MAG: prepilin peptidase [Candidatus Pacearchaeota archaeon]
MEEYYFIFSLALVATFAAAWQDIKRKEIENWLNFSLLGFLLAYRAFYAVQNSQAQFFFLGVGGVIFTTIVANALYYTRTFGGGDAKLLIALGAMLPGENVGELLTYGAGFVVTLLFIGFLYTLFFSTFIALNSRKRFMKNLRDEWGKRPYATPLGIFGLLALLFFFVASFLGWSVQQRALSLAISLLLFSPWLYLYAKALERTMVLSLHPRKLVEGDWLAEEVRIGRRVIGRSVHGLNKDEIKLLVKRGKKVRVINGVPFAPVFFVAVLLLAYAYFFGQGFLINALAIFS